MRASAKVLSLILAAAGLLSLVGGGMSLKDVSTAKSYWEEKGVETDENLGKLEDGLTQLKPGSAGPGQGGLRRRSGGTGRGRKGLCRRPEAAGGKAERV